MYLVCKFSIMLGSILKEGLYNLGFLSRPSFKAHTVMEDKMQIFVRVVLIADVCFSNTIMSNINGGLQSFSNGLYKKYLKYQRNSYNPGRYNEEILITGKINCLKGSALSRLREEITLRQIQEVLECCAPFPGDELQLQHPTDPSYIWNGESRFITDVIDLIDHQLVYVYDRLQGFDTFLS